MTKDEALRPFSMLSANWDFLKFDDETTFDLWFGALRGYDVIEVEQGIRDAVKHLPGKTPVVSDILEYVEDVRRGRRRAAEERDLHKIISNSVKCRDCNDHGYVTIIYPTEYEAVRPCRCEAGKNIWGDMAYEISERAMQDWKVKMLFGEKRPEAFKLIRVSKRHVPTGNKYRTKSGQELDVVKVAYVPYQASGRPKEEVYLMYVQR